jgi:hypothetical protein
MSATPLGTRSLKIKIGTVEFNTDVSNVTIESAAADSDFVSFAQAAAGGARQYTLNFTATQDPADATSIWSQVFNSAGTTAAIKLNPYGNATISATNPMVTGNVIISEPDGTLLGGDADASATARFTMDLSWQFTAKPAVVTSGTY